MSKLLTAADKKCKTVHIRVRRCDSEASRLGSLYMQRVRREVPSEVPNFIRVWRDHRKLTLEELGEIVGFNPMTISRFERGKRQITLDQLQKFAQALHCTLYDLMFRDPEETVGLFKVWAELPTERRELLDRMIKGLREPEANDARKAK